MPAPDIAAVANQSPVPPSSLVEAIRLFYVGAALQDHIAGEDVLPATRSMLVHPERRMQSHTLARRWVQQHRDALLDLLIRAARDPQSQVARDIAQIIEHSLNTLSRDVDVAGVLPDALIPAMLARVEETEIRLINSRQALAQDLDWEDSACWIFVGGDVLQRGFAIRGLTLTWMPREAGAGQVDVLMQRGRWFGYRADFFPYCRVWLPQDVHDDYYALFADHEQALWRSLSEHLAGGKNLADWSRVFWLDPNPGLRLCRRSSQWFRLRRQGEWESQLWLPDDSDAEGVEAAAHNQRLVDKLAASTHWSAAYTAIGSGAMQQHEFAKLPLSQLRDLLAKYATFGDDRVGLAVVRDAIAVLLERDPSESGVIVRMRSGANPRRSPDEGTTEAQRTAPRT